MRKITDQQEVALVALEGIVDEMTKLATTLSALIRALRDGKATAYVPDGDDIDEKYVE